MVAPRQGNIVVRMLSKLMTNVSVSTQSRYMYKRAMVTLDAMLLSNNEV